MKHHSPEPWILQEGFNTIYCIDGGITSAIAKVLSDQTTPEQTAANAALLTATPLMLRALEAEEDFYRVGLLFSPPGTQERVTKLRREALAAAKGEL